MQNVTVAFFSHIHYTFLYQNVNDQEVFSSFFIQNYGIFQLELLSQFLCYHIHLYIVGKVLLCRMSLWPFLIIYTTCFVIIMEIVRGICFIVYINLRDFPIRTPLSIFMLSYPFKHCWKGRNMQNVTVAFFNHMPQPFFVSIQINPKYFSTYVYVYRVSLVFSKLNSSVNFYAIMFIYTLM